MTAPDPRYNTARWQQLRRQIIQRDGGHCTIPDCRTPRTTRSLHVDHILEVRDGGPFWTPTNLTTLCRTHHYAKTLTVIAGRTPGTSPDA